MWNTILAVVNNSFAMRPEVMIEMIRALANSIVTGFLSAYVAKKKGYPFILWFFIGFFTRIYGLIAIVGLPIKKDESPEEA
jgi:hypothetical protein